MEENNGLIWSGFGDDRDDDDDYEGSYTPKIEHPYKGGGDDGGFRPDYGCPSVPEPSTYALLIVGLLMGFILLKRNKKLESQK